MNRIIEYMSMSELRGRRIGFAHIEVYEVWTGDREPRFTCIACDRQVNRGIMSIEYTSEDGVRAYVICHDCFYSRDENMIDQIFEKLDRK